ncbi:MAG: response regulator transcription factor [Chloroflexi bacterium]|nr:response regulator transcription factor [Chloroflexota bacterium]
MDKIRILIVDDHPLMRAALHEAIEIETDFEIVGEAVNGSHAIEMAAKLKPDVIMMDLYMPVMDGIDATAEIIRLHPNIKILTITSSNEDEKVIAAIRAGASGYMLKDSSRERILFGLREVSQGRRFIPPEIGEKLARALQSEKEITVPLTSRENEVLNLIGDGHGNTEIAKTLVLSEATVRVHISNILRKLNFQNRSQLAVYAQKNKPRMS